MYLQLKSIIEILFTISLLPWHFKAKKKKSLQEEEVYAFEDWGEKLEASKPIPLNIDKKRS